MEFNVIDDFTIEFVADTPKPWFMDRLASYCSDIYLLPPIIGAIAADQSEAVLNRERHSAAPSAERELKPASWEINKVTYRTPDTMLCSAQDYRPGEPGGENTFGKQPWGRSRWSLSTSRPV